MEVTRTEGEGPVMESVNQTNNLIIRKPPQLECIYENVKSDWLTPDKIQ